jgi:hypothetical protein
MKSVQASDYRRLFDLCNRGRRLDWFVAVSHSTSSTNGWSNWSDLVFPGRGPGIRASSATPAMTNHGFGYPQLRNRRQRESPRKLLQPVLTELLANSGWDTTEDAIHDTLDALERDAPDASE